MSVDSAQALPNARWDCGGCTACCRHFALGPVADEIIDGLRARQVEQIWPPAAGGFAVRRPGPGGEPAWFLTRRPDGACVFLQDDGLCAVHARWGAEAKPSFCREYPFVVVDLPAGPRVAVRADCGGWSTSFESGVPISEQAAAIADLPRVHPRGRFALDPVELVPGAGVGQLSWPAVEAQLEPTFAQDRSPAGQIAACRDVLFRLVRREPPAPARSRALVARRACARALRQALGAATARPPAADAETRGMVTFLASVVDLLDRADERLDDPGPWESSGRAYFQLALRSEIFGLGFQPWGGLPAFLGGFALGSDIARAAAATGEAGRLGHDFATFVRLTRHAAAHRLLADLRPALLDLFLHTGDP